jgi:hypothetical protein
MKLDSLLGISAKDFGFRFNLVGLLPTVLLMLFWLCLAWSGSPATAPQLGQILERAEELSASQWLILGFGALVVSAVLQPFQVTYLRLLEGYWGSSQLAMLLSRVGVASQRRGRQILLASSQTDKIDQNAITQQEYERMNVAAYHLYHNYPGNEARLLPTALGNVLRSAEARPFENYGLDALVTWPILMPIISSDLKATLADQRNQLDLAARMGFTFMLCTALGIIYLYRWGWWIIIPLGTLGLSYLSYRAAITTAIGFGDSIQAAYHLHRFDMLAALHLPLPADRAAEICSNQQLSNFLKDSREHLIYQHTNKST